ncbi:MAG: AEC family transporter [Eggerthellaceae bacterium]|nr:AEC family transporter [Eggerthellaceae bacterium]
MIFNVVLQTMLIFFLILATGFVAGKFGVIKQEFLPELVKLITKILLPCLIFYSTVSSCTRQSVFDNLPMLALAAGFYLTVTIVMLLAAKALRLSGDRARTFMFCFIFGNTGFVGIPLLSATFPGVGLLYMALFSIVDTPVFWTFGVWLATAKARRGDHPTGPLEEGGGAVHSARHHLQNLKSVLLTPNVVAIALAFLFVLAEIPLPSLVSDTLSTISGATSALCMMYLGALICFSGVSDAFKSKELYVGVAVKMVLLPCAIALLLRLTPLPDDMVTCITLIAALPTMTIVPMIASQRGDWGEYAAGITAATLAFSLATIPLVAFLVL